MPMADNVYFDASPTTAPDVEIISYDWTVGGSAAFTGSTGQLFFEPGSYDVGLTVTDDADNTSSATVSIDVADSSYVDNGQGNSGSGTDCWDVYLVWYDECGQEVSEQYLYSFCCDARSCYQS